MMVNHKEIHSKAKEEITQILLVVYSIIIAKMSRQVHNHKVYHDFSDYHSGHIVKVSGSVMADLFQLIPNYLKRDFLVRPKKNYFVQTCYNFFPEKQKFHLWESLPSDNFRQNEIEWFAHRSARITLEIRTATIEKIASEQHIHRYIFLRGISGTKWRACCKHSLTMKRSQN